ncbi:uncharacterized protein LOC132710519 [Pantherophis guttatus]|uniref:Uncharacterized protein LOC132710519 n=1 Tax=Pantherophis guttatus TaxID=94885 RepID=A0ABM3Z3E4_PANGU|nr:uncharacterized protein LOC132710519 [Pantherophis guttatus]
MEGDSQFKTAKPVCVVPALQDAFAPVHSGMYPTRGSPTIHRYPGGLSSRTDTSQSQALPQIRLQRMALSIQGHAVWTVVGAKNLYKNSSGFGSFVEGTFHPHRLLPGRHSAAIDLSLTNSPRQSVCYSGPTKSRLCPQSGQEPSCSNNVHFTPWSDNRLIARPCLSIPGLSVKYQGHCEPGAVTNFCTTSSAVPTVGEVNIMYTHRTVGTSPLTSPTVVSPSLPANWSVRVVYQSPGLMSSKAVSPLVGLSSPVIRDSVFQAS